MLNTLSEKYEYTGCLGFLSWKINNTYYLYPRKDMLLDTDCLEFELYSSLNSMN